MCPTGGTATFEGAIVAHNGGSSGGGVCVKGGATVAFAWSDVYGNDGDWSGTADQTGTSGNVSVDPGFVSYGSSLDSSTWSLALAPDSALWGAGDPSRLDEDGTSAQPGAWGGPDADAWFDYYTDADADGMYDGWEIAWGLDPTVDDSADDADGDGLDNAAEFAAGTSPDDPDTDNDRATDGAEVSAGTNPLGLG